MEPKLSKILVISIQAVLLALSYIGVPIYSSTIFTNTVDSRYLDFGYLEQPLISKKKSGPCLNIEI